MISVIVCSVNNGLLEKLKQNVAETIGTVYEILSYDNSLVQKGIAAVYNMQASKAKYEILCFIHEDVIIHTEGWGNFLVDVLDEKCIGLVGISGSVYKSKYAATWSSCQPQFYRTNSIQHFKNNLEPVNTYINPENTTYSEVAVVDGVFMATRKDVFAQNAFDEKLIKGFHGYDIDYSIRVRQNYKVIVSYAIVLEHLSEGILSDRWLKDSIVVHKKWIKQLPISTVKVEREDILYNDYLAVKTLLSVALKSRSHKKLVFINFLRLLFRFHKFNGYEFSKSVVKHLLNVNFNRYYEKI